MANKKFSFTDLVFLIILLCGLLAISGCASQASRGDSANYVAQAQSQGYPCPSCGFLIPDKDVSINIRTENKCPNCGKIFFGVPVLKKTQRNEGKQVAFSGLKSNGPRSIYESDINYQYLHLYGESFKETETGYSFLSWRFCDSKIKSRRVIPYWTTRRYSY